MRQPREGRAPSHEVASVVVPTRDGGIITAVRTHLEMPALTALRPAVRPPGDYALRQEHLSPRAYRALYLAVGAEWLWRDRLLLEDEELDAYFASPDVQLWILRAAGHVAGYFELHRHENGRVEIVYFGLIGRYFGRGLGGWMLTRAIKQAFELEASLVTLHTCTLDSPHALPNYLARGFVITREEEYEVETGAPLAL